MAGAVWITYSTTTALGVGSGAPGLGKRGWEVLLNCQAQPQLQLSWAELALVSSNTPTPTPGQVVKYLTKPADGFT